MKNPIVAIALAGTARHEQVKAATDTPLDALFAGWPEGEAERALLLQAGAWAVYRQAGMQAESVEAHTSAAPETLSECSPEAALLLSRLLNGERGDLLPEALERMSRFHLRLPFKLLPLALNVTDKERRAALFPLLGERGHWLSQFNKSWQWVNNYLAAEEHGLPAEAETIWQDGTHGQRVEILRRQRAVDPVLARTWLEDVWKQEKAEAREEMLATLEIGLSADDEPFLERALDDRAGGVRSTAASLLTRLPGSALCQRLRQYGAELLTRVGMLIEANPPEEFRPEWRRDGFNPEPQVKISKRGWWLIQVLSAIEPAFWETHLSASPAELVRLLPPDYEWTPQIMEGWSKAALHFRASSWLAPLWSWWYSRYKEMVEKRALTHYQYREELLHQMPGQEAERLILDLIDRQHGQLPEDWWELFPELEKPWSAEFASFFLQLTRKRAALEKVEAEDFNPYVDPLLRELPNVAFCLPTASFAEALQPWELSEGTKWQIGYVNNQIKEFLEIVHLRQKINEEIA